MDKPAIKIITRAVYATDVPDRGVVSGATLERYVTQYVEDGYKVMSVTPFGRDPEGFIHVMVVLVRDGAHV